MNRKLTAAEAAAAAADEERRGRSEMRRSEYGYGYGSSSTAKQYDSNDRSRSRDRGRDGYTVSIADELTKAISSLKKAQEQMTNNSSLIDGSVVSKAGTVKMEALATSKFASAAFDIIAPSSSASSSSSSRVAPAISQESLMSIGFYQRKKTKLENELRVLNEQFARTDIDAGQKFVISVEIEYNVTEIKKLHNLIDKLNGSQQRVHASHNKKTDMGGSKRMNKTKRRAANKDK